MRLRTIAPETRSASEELEVQVGEQSAGASRLERMGFPAGFKPLRESALVVLLVAPIVTIVYRLYDAHWKVPFNYNGDGLSTAAYIKSIIENGWYFHNPRLAAPFTADWRDFPVGGENLHWFALKILGVVTGNYAIAMNTYFVLGFFLIALSTYFVARYLAFRVATSLVISVLYAFLPFHAFRNSAHLARGVYYAVPPAVLVILWAANYRSDFFRDEDGKPRWRRGRVAAAVVIGLVLGSSDTQNAAFLISILGVLMLVCAVRDRDWRPLALLALVGAATFGALFVNNTPYLLARVQRGPNTVAANRPLSDQDYYGLRPVELVLPAPGHRIPALRKLTDKADKGKITNSESAGTPLGTIGTIGFVWSIGAVLALGLGARARKDSTRFVAQLGVLNVTAILIGAIGGFAFLLALAGFGTYRTWNRISLFIAFASLIAVGFLLDRMFGFISKRLSTTSKIVGILVAGVVVFVLALGGALDQITPRYVTNYAKSATRFDIDATFYHDLEKSLPKSSMVFQLPFEQFPEAGTIAQMSDYQDFTGYLHTKNLRWNYAGMKGRREGDWQQNLSIYDPVATVGEIAAAGFQGIVVDRSGFTDRGESFLGAVQPYVGSPVLSSQDDRLLYLDLTGLRARLNQQLGNDAVAHDAQVVLGDAIHWTGFSFPEPVCGGTRRWATSRTGTVELENHTKAPITVTASTSFEANPQAKAIKVRAPGVSDTVVLTNGTGRFERQLTLPPGASEIQFTLVGPGVEAASDARTLQFSLVHYSFGSPFDSPVVAWAHSLEPSCSATP